MTPMTARLTGRDKECIALGYSPSALLNNDQLHAVAVVSELLARIAALESALEPFAREAASFCTDLPDDTAAGEVDFLTLGDFRRAALTLNKDTTNAEG